MKNAQNTYSGDAGRTWGPSFAVTLGKIARNGASYAWTAPGAALVAEADLAVSTTSRRKLRGSHDNAPPAGGRTSCSRGAWCMDRSVGVGLDPCGSSPNSTGHWRPGPDRSRSAGLATGGQEAARESYATAVRENVTDGPRHRQRRQHIQLTHTTQTTAGAKVKWKFFTFHD